MSATKIRCTDTKKKSRYNLHTIAYSVQNSQLGNVCLAHTRISMNDNTLGMSHWSTINGWRINVLINGGFENIKSKDLLLVGLITLLVKLSDAFYQIPITVTEMRDSLYFLSRWDTLYVLNILVYWLKLLAHVNFQNSLNLCIRLLCKPASVWGCSLAENSFLMMISSSSFWTSGMNISVLHMELGRNMSSSLMYKTSRLVEYL